MKMTISFKLIILACVMIGSEVISIKVENMASLSNKSKFSPEYSKTDTPDVLAKMFKIVKKASATEGTMYDECTKLILNVKNEEQMKTFWNSVKSVSCKTDLFKREHFFNLVSNTLEKIKVDGKDQDCRSIVERNFQPQSDVEGDFIQRELRDQFSVFFDCPPPIEGAKTIITAFLGPHRGDAQTNLFQIMNNKWKSG